LCNYRPRCHHHIRHRLFHVYMVALLVIILDESSTVNRKLCTTVPPRNSVRCRSIYVANEFWKFHAFELFGLFQTFIFFLNIYWHEAMCVVFCASGRWPLLGPQWYITYFATFVLILICITIIISFYCRQI